MRAHFIDPYTETVTEIDLPDAEPGTIRNLLGVKEYTVTGLGSGVIGYCDDLGMYRSGQRYWHFDLPGSLTMMAGRLIIVSHDEEGETVDLDQRVPLSYNQSIVRFIGDAEAAERAIAENRVSRPSVKLNGQTIWEWTPAMEGTQPL